MTNPHPDFEALSAHHDGEAPEVAAHVNGCAACRTTLRWLRITTAMVSSPVPPAPAAVRERALARALEAFGASESAPDAMEGPVAAQQRPAPAPVPVTRTSEDAPAPITSARSRRWSGSGLWVGVGSAAAVLVAFVLGVGVLAGGGGGGGDDGATVAAGAPPTQERFAGEAGPTLDTGAGVGDTGATGAGTAGGVDGGDLGELIDATGLVARARPTLLERDVAPTPAPVTGIAPAGAGESGLTSRFVGTRPCEMEARAVRPELGTVVYYAVGQVGGVPVVVLGFAPGPPPAPVTLLALARQEGCRVVLEAAGP